MRNDELDLIYRDYYPAIYRYLFTLCKSRAVAEDLAHETFVRALLHISECDYSTIRSWLFKVAHNLYLDFLKKEKRIDYDHNLEDITSLRRDLKMQPVLEGLIWNLKIVFLILRKTV